MDTAPGYFECLFIGSDHNGHILKEQLLDYFQRMYPTKVIINIGTYNINRFVDYPDIVKEYKKGINKMKTRLNFDNPLCILIGKTGIGMSIAANKIKTVRAAVCNTMNDIFSSKLYNNINTLCMGNNITYTEIIKIVESFLKLEFEHDKVHEKCIKKIHKV
jgi:ribose 5-phosphate isomerase B